MSINIDKIVGSDGTIDPNNASLWMLNELDQISLKIGQTQSDSDDEDNSSSSTGSATDTSAITQTSFSGVDETDAVDTSVDTSVQDTSTQTTNSSLSSLNRAANSTTGYI